MRKAGFFTAVLFSFFLASPAVGQNADEGEKEYRFLQGVISSYGSASVVLNESQRINISHDTRFYDSRGRESGLYGLGDHKWIYVEGTPGPGGGIEAEKIFFLPRYIGKKERTGYGYMQLP